MKRQQKMIDIDFIIIKSGFGNFTNLKVFKELSCNKLVASKVIFKSLCICFEACPTNACFGKMDHLQANRQNFLWGQYNRRNLFIVASAVTVDIHFMIAITCSGYLFCLLPVVVNLLCSCGVAMKIV